VSAIRYVLAHNASPMTLDGTRTYLIGRRNVAVIDAGPALDAHFDAVMSALGEGVAVGVLNTHQHADHAEGAQALAQRLDTGVYAVADGDEVGTDAGPLRALHTPGHTPDHFSFYLEAERAVFCGDLMMGGLDTALVAPPEGDLQEYLNSLEKIRALDCRIIYPAHGPAITDVDATITRYMQHRLERVQQALSALQSGPASAEELVDRIYGAELDPVLKGYAADAVLAYLMYLRNGGVVDLRENRWSRA
jgi:hydroxyacylglutathione hydrolase